MLKNVVIKKLLHVLLLKDTEERDVLYHGHDQISICRYTHSEYILHIAYNLEHIIKRPHPVKTRTHKQHEAHGYHECHNH